MTAELVPGCWPPARRADAGAVVMTTCAVLRCERTGYRTFVIPAGDGENDEKAICATHHAAMLNGARWVSAVEASEVLMGSDAPPVLSGVALRREGSSSLSSSPVFLRVRIQHSDGSERDTDIEITDQVELLRSLLSWQ
jgi:hypothetical protein